MYFGFILGPYVLHSLINLNLYIKLTPAILSTAQEYATALADWVDKEARVFKASVCRPCSVLGLHVYDFAAFRVHAARDLSV